MWKHLHMRTWITTCMHDYACIHILLSWGYHCLLKQQQQNRIHKEQHQRRIIKTMTIMMIVANIIVLSSTEKKSNLSIYICMWLDMINQAIWVHKNFQPFQLCSIIHNHYLLMLAQIITNAQFNGHSSLKLTEIGY